MRETISAMASVADVLGCALVGTEDGLIWYQVNKGMNIQPLCEAAVNYWRLHDRMASQFENIGPLFGCVMLHSKGRITMLPSGKDAILIAITEANPDIDWKAWQQQTRELAHLVNQF